jgi:hypothetical protein
MPQDAVPPSPSPSPPTISPESPRVPSSADFKLHDDTTPKPEECSGIPDAPSSAPRHSAEPLEVPVSSATDSPDPEPFVMSVVHPDAGPSMPVAYFVTSRYLRMIADGYTTEGTPSYAILFSTTLICAEQKSVPWPSARGTRGSPAHLVLRTSEWVNEKGRIFGYLEAKEEFVIKFRPCMRDFDRGRGVLRELMNRGRVGMTCCRPNGR